MKGEKGSANRRRRTAAVPKKTPNKCNERKSRHGDCKFSLTLKQRDAAVVFQGVQAIPGVDKIQLGITSSQLIFRAKSSELFFEARLTSSSSFKPPEGKVALFDLPSPFLNLLNMLPSPEIRLDCFAQGSLSSALKGTAVAFLFRLAAGDTEAEFWGQFLGMYPDDVFSSVDASLISPKDVSKAIETLRFFAADRHMASNAPILAQIELKSSIDSDDLPRVGVGFAMRQHRARVYKSPAIAGANFKISRKISEPLARILRILPSPTRLVECGNQYVFYSDRTRCIVDRFHPASSISFAKLLGPSCRLGCADTRILLQAIGRILAQSNERDQEVTTSVTLVPERRLSLSCRVEGGEANAYCPLECADTIGAPLEYFTRRVRAESLRDLLFLPDGAVELRFTDNQIVFIEQQGSAEDQTAEVQTIVYAVSPDR